MLAKTPVSASPTQQLRTRNTRSPSRYGCPAGLKCPVEFRLEVLEQQFRDREAWWRIETDKLSQKYHASLANVTADSNFVFTRQKSQLRDPVANDLIARLKRYREFSDIDERYTYYLNLNTRRRFFNAWRTGSGSGNNELMGKIERQKKEIRALTKKCAHLDELERAHAQLQEVQLQTSESHRVATEDAATQQHLRRQAEFRIRLLEDRVASLEQQLDKAKKEIARYQQDLAKERQRVRERDAKIATLGEQVAEAERWKEAQGAREAAVKKQVEKQAEHTTYWRQKYEKLLSGKQSEPGGKKSKLDRWFKTECDFCGQLRLRRKPCEFCGHLSDNNPMLASAGWKLRIPKFLLAWKSVVNYQEEGVGRASLIMVSQNLEGVFGRDPVAAQYGEHYACHVGASPRTPEHRGSPKQKSIAFRDRKGKMRGGEERRAEEGPGPPGGGASVD